MNAKGIIKRTIKDSTLNPSADGLLKENIREYYGKRAVDLFISIPLLIISVPLMLTIAFFIKLGSKGPILFKQTRLGKAGKPFIFCKFRTMYHGQSETSHKEYMNNIIKNGNSPNGIYKMTNDKRVTSFGYLLRILSLDEFPQLVNVLKGEMSLVGPRPPIPYEVKVYEN